MDIVTPEKRSLMMAAVPQRDSKPELVVRHIVHALGYRYRLHVSDLPGTPDLVLPAPQGNIRAQSHRHGCRLTTTPSTRQAFWQEKVCRKHGKGSAEHPRITRTGMGGVGDMGVHGAPLPESRILLLEGIYKRQTAYQERRSRRLAFITVPGSGSRDTGDGAGHSGIGTRFAACSNHTVHDGNPEFSNWIERDARMPDRSRPTRPQPHHRTTGAPTRW